MFKCAKLHFFFYTIKYCRKIFQSKRFLMVFYGFRQRLGGIGSQKWEKSRPCKNRAKLVRIFFLSRKSMKNFDRGKLAK